MLKVIKEAAVADGEGALREASDRVHAVLDRITGRSRASVPAQAPEPILARTTEPTRRVTTKPAPLPLPRADWSARLRAAAVVTCVLLACGSLGATCG